MHFLDFQTSDPLFTPMQLLHFFLKHESTESFGTNFISIRQKTLVSAFKLSHLTQNISLKFLAKMIYQIEVLLTT